MMRCTCNVMQRVTGCANENPVLAINLSVFLQNTQIEVTIHSKGLKVLIYCQYLK